VSLCEDCQAVFSLFRPREFRGPLTIRIGDITHISDGSGERTLCGLDRKAMKEEKK